MIRRGEEQLHRVCELLCETFLDSTIPLFGFYRDLFRWLFLSLAEPAPAFEGRDRSAG